MSKMDFRIVITGRTLADNRKLLENALDAFKQSFADHGIDVDVKGRLGFRDLEIRKIPKQQPEDEPTGEREPAPAGDLEVITQSGEPAPAQDPERAAMLDQARADAAKGE